MAENPVNMWHLLDTLLSIFLSFFFPKAGKWGLIQEFKLPASWFSANQFFFFTDKKSHESYRVQIERTYIAQILQQEPHYDFKLL